MATIYCWLAFFANVPDHPFDYSHIPNEKYCEAQANIILHTIRCDLKRLEDVCGATTEVNNVGMGFIKVSVSITGNGEYARRLREEIDRLVYCHNIWSGGCWLRYYQRLFYGNKTGFYQPDMNTVKAMEDNVDDIRNHLIEEIGFDNYYRWNVPHFYMNGDELPPPAQEPS